MDVVHDDVRVVENESQCYTRRNESITCAWITVNEEMNQPWINTSQCNLNHEKSIEKMSKKKK